jgi:tetratricopeptide (TPR) repeat protein
VTQSNDLRNSFLFFKQVPEGYVFRAPNPWIFGHADHYLVSEAQRDAIAAILLPRRTALGQAKSIAIVAGAILALCAGLGGIIFLVSDWLSEIGNVALIVGTMTATILLLFCAVHFATRRNLRRVQPILAGAQRTGQQITNAEIQKGARERVSLKQAWLTALAFGAIGLCQLAVLVFDRNQKLPFFSDTQVFGPMLQMVLFTFLATASFRTALKKIEQNGLNTSSNTSMLARRPRYVVLGTALALLGLALMVAFVGVRREFSDYSQGLRSEAMGDHDNAIASFSRAIEAHPNDPAAYVARAEILRAKGDRQQAIVDYDKAIELDPKVASAYVSRSRIREAAGDHDGAIADLTAALEINPKDANAYVARARIFAAKRDHERAMADFGKAISIGPRYSFAHFWRGTMLAAKGDHNGAIEDFTKALEFHPKDPYIYLYRARSHAAKGEHGLAVADFTKSIENKPDYALAYRERGAAYVQIGDRAAAVADFAKTVELDPKDVFAYASRGVILASMNNHDAAIADFTKALALDPKNVGNYVVRGRSFAAKNDHDRAVADFTAAIALDAKNKSAYSSRAASYAVTGPRDLAISDYNTVLALPSATDVDRQWQSQARDRLARLAATK